MPTQRPTTIRLRTSLFEEATEIVDQEYASDLSLDEIARRVASSRRQLQRAYAEIGQTIAAVARSVGYSQPAQFAKAFWRHHGVTPSAFRAHVRHAAQPLPSST